MVSTNIHCNTIVMSDDGVNIIVGLSCGTALSFQCSQLRIVLPKNL